MSEIKAIVSLILPGRTMYTEEECRNNSNLYETIQVKNGRDTSYVKIRRCKPAVQKIKITEEAYKQMTQGARSPEEYHYSHKDKDDWKYLTNHQRFVYHVTQIKNDVGATLFHIEYID